MEKTYKPRRNPDLTIRVNEEECKIINENAKKFGFHTVSEYLRFVGINTKQIVIIND